MKQPADYIRYGVLLWLVGAAVSGLLAASTAPLGLVLVAAAVAGLAGGVLLSIGVVAIGVRIGLHDD